MDGMGAQTYSSANAVIQVETDQFLKLFKEAGDPMVVHQKPTWLQPYHRYMMMHRGMTFFTKSKEPLSLSRYAEIVEAKSIHTPFAI